MCTHFPVYARKVTKDKLFKVEPYEMELGTNEVRTVKILI